MIFTETKLKGAYIVEIEKLDDERGFFARTWDKKQFEERGLNATLIQCSISYNKKKGTLRGLHYQTAPYEESKVVKCTRGKIFDVIVDLRPMSDTFKQWISFELSTENYKMLYIPKGFAHGFQTLKDDSDVLYQISEVYMKYYASGIRWDDPTFNINWPIKLTVISARDLAYKNFN